MTKAEIMDYVLHTPYNTNPAILSQMLDEYLNVDILSTTGVTQLSDETIVLITEKEEA